MLTVLTTVQENPMTSRGPLATATLVGTAVQVAMVVIGHYVPAVANGFAAGGTAISALAGLAYAVLAQQQRLGAVLAGGAVAGGVSAFVGILVSYLLGDVPAAVLGFGTAGSVVAGSIGAAVGRFARRRRTA
jgi:hypothetical protein